MIDWNRVLLLRQEVGAEDFDEVVELFLCEVGDAIDALNSHPPGEGLVETLHFLKGSGLSFGLRDFSSLCHAGEAALHKNPCQKIDVDAIVGSYRASRRIFLENLTAHTAG